MTDFVAGQERTCFERFRNRPDLQTEVLADLVRVIRKNVRLSIASTVFLEDWRAVNQDYYLQECRLTPYAIGAVSVLSKSVLWIGKPKKPVRSRTHHRFDEFVFEQGDAGHKDFKWIMEEAVRVGHGKLDSIYPVFKPKTVLPLQSCDLLAWEQRTVIKKHLDNVDTPWRDSFEALTNVPNMWGAIERVALAGWADALSVPKRPESFDRRTWKPAFRVGNL